MSNRPNVVLSTEVLPEYYPELAAQSLRAFSSTEISLRLFPIPLRPSLEQRILWNVYNRTKRASQPKGDLVEVVALVDGKPVGIASWLVPVDRTSTGGDPLPEELQAKELLKFKEEKEGKPAIEVEMDAATDKEFAKAFGAEMDRVRKEWSKGRPHWYLKFLFVNPDFEGSGIGSRLLDWGTKQAEAAGVPCWLESTDSGRFLYDRRGWEVESWCEVDAADLPGGKLRWPGMKRESLRDKSW